jgi:hypothetical protein
MKTLDEFITEIKKDIKLFEKKYRKKHLQNPKNYPLEISDDNSGVWLEMFIRYTTDHTV